MGGADARTLLSKVFCRGHAEPPVVLSPDIVLCAAVLGRWSAHVDGKAKGIHLIARAEGCKDGEHAGCWRTRTVAKVLVVLPIVSALRNTCPTISGLTMLAPRPPNLPERPMWWHLPTHGSRQYKSCASARRSGDRRFTASTHDCMVLNRHVVRQPTSSACWAVTGASFTRMIASCPSIHVPSLLDPSWLPLPTTAQRPNRFGVGGVVAFRTNSSATCIISQSPDRLT